MLGKKNAVRLRRLLDVMIPILITQTAIMAMNFCDSAMSGHAGAVHLAGTAIGGNLWMPVMASLNGILLGSMPIIAHLLGRGERQNIGRVVRHTMLLATVFSLLLLIGGVLFLDRLLGTFGLEPQVHYIAKMYIAAIGVGVLPFFLSTALRALVDTSGYTGITMKIYLLALPVNAFLNYCLIFGKFGAPALGGIVPNLVQDRDEGLVLLPIDLTQFDRHEVYLLEDAGGEEKGAGVEETQYFLLVGGHDRLQLEDIADEKQLLSPERQTHIVGEDAEDAVHAIDDVRPDHGYLVDDNQFDFGQELTSFLGVFEEIEDASLCQT